MHVKIAALVQTSKWSLPLDAGGTRTPVASHFFIVVMRTPSAAERGGRSCPNEARPAPISPREATGACPLLGPLARQEPGAGVISHQYGPGG